jgi:hypothetical protein
VGIACAALQILAGLGMWYLFAAVAAIAEAAAHTDSELVLEVDTVAAEVLDVFERVVGSVQSH